MSRFERPGLSAVILAGGRSSRMGRDKAWIERAGQPLVVRARDAVREAGADECFISGQHGTDYSRLGCPVLLDLEPGLGPLGGIERALAACGSPLLLVVAVDLAGMTAVFLRRLVDRCRAYTGVVPQLGGALEPLAAIYPKCCHELAVRALVNGQRSAQEFARACLRERAVRVVPVARGDARCFANWNRPEDVASA